MGLGDELMAAGHARMIHRRGASPLPVRIVGADGVQRWHELWDGLGFVAKPHAPFGATIVNGPNARPYIKRWVNWHERPQTIYADDWIAGDARPVVALTDADRAIGRNLAASFGRFAVFGIAPSRRASPNKAWDMKKFGQVARLLQDDIAPIVLSEDGSLAIPYAVTIQTPTFREALGVLSYAALYVGVEGFHHGAAAFGVPSVVLMGHFANPRAVGYPDHVNLTADGGGCGRWAVCPDCRAWMVALEPDTVADHALRVLQEFSPRRDFDGTDSIHTCR